MGRALEIAAGTGLNFAHYSPDVTVIATEPNLDMLARARVRAKAVPATMLFAAAAEALPFRPNSFDTCVIVLGLCTIASRAAALAEVQRADRPGGSARLLEHGRIESPIVGLLQDALTPAWRRIFGGCRLN